jgi:hypothetical protein
VVSAADPLRSLKDGRINPVNSDLNFWGFEVLNMGGNTQIRRRKRRTIS